MEATYYTYFLYILIAMFISIAIILSAKNDNLKNRLRISKKNNDDQKTIIGSQSAEIARIHARLSFQSEDLIKLKKQYAEIANRLRISQKNNDDQKVIIDSQYAEVAKMREVTREVTKEMYEKIKKLYEARKELLEYLQMTREENIETLTAPLIDRREKESDAQYFKRCRQVVANKAATYVKVNDRITLRVISHD